VALRPVVQDGVLPSVAMACGPGELAYLAQLREVFEGLEVRAACPVPRFTATWLPPAALALLEASGADPWEVVAATDVVLKQHAERLVPAELRDQLAAIRAELTERLERFATSSTRVDASLPQMVESARGKVDYQFARLLEPPARFFITALLGLGGKRVHQAAQQEGYDRHHDREFDERKSPAVVHRSVQGETTTTRSLTAPGKPDRCSKIKSPGVAFCPSR